MVFFLVDIFLKKEERVRVKSVNVLDGLGKLGLFRMYIVICLFLRNLLW